MASHKKLLVVIFVSVIMLGGIAAAIYFAVRDNDPYISQAPPQLSDPPLKELAERRGVQLGSFASLKYLRERPYADILASEFEYVIIDGEPNWQFEDATLRPGKDEFDFTDMDQVFDFADQNDMPVRVQHLLWGDDKWLPEWLKDGEFNRAELLEIIRDHIYMVGTRYRSKVREYTVVNEAFSRKLETGGNKDWWGERLGTEYIDKAFMWSREADPNAVLILNDFGNETQGNISDLMYEYIKDAKARGVPIDGLGMQMHISAANVPSKDEVVANMRRFADLGVKIYVTEFDVNMHDVQMNKAEEESLQAEIYKAMLGACLEVGPEVCANFGFFRADRPPELV